MNRREFVGGGMAAAAALTLRIETISHEVAPGFVYRTSAYNGRAPAPLIRLREGVPVTVDIFNDTACEEYVHWHGFELPPALDGTQEEGGRAVPARGHLRYELIPTQPGMRWVHSHAMAHGKLDRGVYSGQYEMVYVEPRRHPGNYDREYFLAAQGRAHCTRKQRPREFRSETGPGLGPERRLRVLPSCLPRQNRLPRAELVRAP